MEQHVKSKVDNVAVYTAQARIGLTGDLSLKEGKQVLIFDDLPLSIMDDSVRFSGKGSAIVRIHGVDLRILHHERVPVEKVTELEDEIQTLEDKLAEIHDHQKVLDAEAAYLDGMFKATKQYARGLAIGRTKASDQEQLAKSLSQQSSDNKQAARVLVQKERSVKEKLDKLQRDLEDHYSSRSKKRYQARVEIEVLGEGRFQVELNYVVREAGWQPLYDIRLLEQEAGYKLQITNIAQVTQKTGQDWSGVSLSLSTARTALAKKLPELDPWYLDEYSPPIARAEKRRMSAPSMQSLAEVSDSEFVGVVHEIAAAEVPGEHAIATMDQSQSVTVFKIEGKADIPSDGFPHKTTINNFLIAPDIDYFAVPLFSDAIYRRITARNSTPGPLLAGKASLFVGDDYIGQSNLEYVPTGDKFELLMGVEDRLAVERELVGRDVDKVRLRDRRQIVYSYELSLKNLMSTNVIVEVQDRYPVSKHEEIRCKLVEVTPEPTDESDLNLLTWEIALEGNTERKIRFVFQVEYPRSMNVQGLYI